MRPSIYSERYQRFRVLLREIRKEKELTQVELAEALGQLQSYVSKYESGERRLDVVEFMDLCDALKVDPREVIGRLMAPPDPATVPSPPLGEG